MSGGKKKKKAGETSDFPALRQFFSGYLHQDFADEYGSALDAAKAYRREAGKSDLATIRKEWKNWRAERKNLSADGLASELRKLGAAWAPLNLATLDEVGQILEQG
jgi:hypothetical protein